MAIDTEYLQSYYASLSDDGLRDVDRAELVEAARQCYDREVETRKLAPPGEGSEPPYQAKPEWLDEAVEVFSVSSNRRRGPGEDVVKVRTVLETAGIPCYLEYVQESPAQYRRLAKYRWRVCVPGRVNMWATSVLDREIFNDEFEALWRTHLEMLTDRELAEAEPTEVFCGLFDRIERTVRAYNDELSRRGLQSSR